MAPAPASTNNTIEQPLGELSAAERSVVRTMRELKPFQKIEIKLRDNRLGEITVISTVTLREDFPEGLL